MVSPCRQTQAPGLLVDWHGSSRKGPWLGGCSAVLVSLPRQVLAAGADQRPGTGGLCHPASPSAALLLLSCPCQCSLHWPGPVESSGDPAERAPSSPASRWAEGQCGGGSNCPTTGNKGHGQGGRESGAPAPTSLLGSKRRQGQNPPAGISRVPPSSCLLDTGRRLFGLEKGCPT